MITTLSKEDFEKSDWFKERPEEVQQMLRERSPCERLYLKVEDKDEYYGVTVIGVDVYGDKPSTYRIYVKGIMPPITERTVFGIKKEDLFTAEQVVGKEIMYEAD